MPPKSSADPKAAAIHVVIRVRPFVPRELKAKEKRCISVETSAETGKPELVLSNPSDPKKDAKVFALDGIFDSSCDPAKQAKYFYDQNRVYEDLGKRILKEVKAGFNNAAFAYGQTGSGKSTTMMGEFSPPSARGILPRLLEDMFSSFEDEKRKFAETSGNGGEDTLSIHCRVRMLEIYNERIQDLLRSSDQKVGQGQQKKLEVRVHPKFGVYVPDLTVETVENCQDCLQLIDYAHTMQTVAATAMNAQSSRAHTIFAIKVEKTQKISAGEDDKKVEVTETFESFIVDLAGRENERTTLATGERLVELSFINKSLFHLANCIHALGSKGGGGGSGTNRTAGEYGRGSSI